MEEKQKTMGGFTVGHKATVAFSKEPGTIVDLMTRGGRQMAIIEFRVAQPVDGPDGVTARRFEVGLLSITSTWKEL